MVNDARVGSLHFSSLGWGLVVMSIKIFRHTQVQVAVLTALWFFGVSMLTLA